MIPSQALPNLSMHDRCSVILYYDAARPPSASFEPSVRRLDAAGKLDERPSLRHMLRADALG